MTAEPARPPVRSQGFRQRMVRRWIMLATVTEVLRDHRFQEKAITVAIGAVALAQLGRDNQARPVRRAAGWYKKVGVSQELARVHDAVHDAVEDALEDALKPGKNSQGQRTVKLR